MINSCIPFVFSCLVLFLITTTTTTISTSVGGNETDYQALLHFKSMIIYDPHEALSSWNDSVHFCDWSGVSCGKRHRRVTALDLYSQDLQGSLSPHVGNLSFLRRFSLTSNRFQGSIPHQLRHLSRLRFLYLDSNNFTGVIPTNLSGCFHLQHLSIQFNNLAGGGIPPALGNTTSMKVFSATGNPLGGRIPDTLRHWKSLTEFHCGGCNLYGPVPHSLYNLSLLTHFSLHLNQLYGSLPSDLGAMLPHLRHLRLWGNHLSGPLPPSISNCSKLRLLEVHDNKFSGKLTIDFSKLKDISYISLSNNMYGFREVNDMQFFDTLKNCSKLETLYLYNCQFHGVVPTSIGNILSDQLRFLDLGGNHLYGKLPSSIGDLVGLTTLGLAQNRFTGEIPSTIGKLQKLVVADLSENQFSGMIPDTIGKLSLLTKLRLASNRLEGHIPPSLGNCYGLLVLDLQGNKLSGRITRQLLQPSSLNELDLSQNSLYGTLPAEIGDLKMLIFLNLSNNNLSSEIPSSLGGCNSLVFLSLKGNLFQGIVPPSLSSMRGVRTLDLSLNNLSGHIPRFLEPFSFKYVNLSFNYLEGEVPVIGLFANASAFSVLGNNRLCGGLVELGLPKCKETRKHKKWFLLFIIAILTASILFTMSCLVYARCKKSKGQVSQPSTSEHFKRVSYNQLLKATNGFSEANLIGDGGFSSVYKGILDHEDRFVAIKVIHLLNRGAHKSFVAECEAWRSIRHRNLLKIITSCSSVDFQGNDFKALIYEFMPNGNLHDWLHSSASTSRLNFLQRVNILIDVASALDYLHNHCLPAIVHCDVKPSNILLDDNMVAHVGDFGLARFLGTNSNQNNTSGIRGTIGYAPPEYGVGSEITSSGDVYSFGILLLEVMTGKRPTDNIFNEGLNIHKFVCMALPDHVIDVIDADLLNFLQEDAIATQCTLANAKKINKCLASIVKIGVLCSLDSPSQRMNIGNVVHELQHIQDILQ